MDVSCGPILGLDIKASNISDTYPEESCLSVMALPAALVPCVFFVIANSQFSGYELLSFIQPEKLLNNRTKYVSFTKNRKYQNGRINFSSLIFFTASVVQFHSQIKLKKKCCHFMYKILQLYAKYFVSCGGTTFVFQADCSLPRFLFMNGYFRCITEVSCQLFP